MQDHQDEYCNENDNDRYFHTLTICHALWYYKCQPFVIERNFLIEIRHTCQPLHNSKGDHNATVTLTMNALSNIKLKAFENMQILPK